GERAVCAPMGRMGRMGPMSPIRPICPICLSTLANISLPARVLLYRRPSSRGSIDTMHETFEHTADLGLRIRAGDLNTLFAEAGEALFATILDGDLSAVAARQEVTVRLPSDDLDYLLCD